jgi:hypothetical protein
MHTHTDGLLPLKRYRVPKEKKNKKASGKNQSKTIWTQ